MKRKRIAIVGAGVGGLGAALRLAHRGHSVTVLEKNDFWGGRNRSEQVGDCRFDGGPTLLMMLDPFRKLFSDVGERFEDHVKIQLCDPIYRVYFADGTRFDSTTNVNQMVERITAMSGSENAAKYPGFLHELRELYEESIPHFVRKNYNGLAGMISAPQVIRVLRRHMLSNLEKRVRRRFSDQKLRMLFTFQTMYLGLSPFNAPWVYATLAYMEYGEGIWYPQGGMSAISNAIAKLAVAKGAQIRLGSPVKSVQGSNVVLESGEVVQSDIVVVNADMPYGERELAQEQPTRKLRYSCSAHLLYIDYDGELEDLNHHSVFFGNDFEGNLRSLFHDLVIPTDPAFYVCCSNKSDPSMAPQGRTNLFVLVPVPNLDCVQTPDLLAKLEEEVFDRLAREIGFDKARLRGIKRRGAAEWKQELNLDKGAAFGISHDLFQSAFMRPQNQSKTNKKLFYVGASTVPGNGLPMVLISAELLEQRLIETGDIPA